MSPTTSSECLVALATLLLPIQARSQALESWGQATMRAETESEWVVVDDSINNGNTPEELLDPSEADLLALLDLISFEMVARDALQVEGTYRFYPTSRQGFLRMIALFSRLLQVFETSFRVYCDEKYNRFTRRVARLVCHSVEYIADHWEMLAPTLDPRDVLFNYRLQVSFEFPILNAKLGRYRNYYCYWLYYFRLFAISWITGLSWSFNSIDALEFLLIQVFYPSG